ncbi:S41 family peptidase [Bacteroidota bacterium]
MSTLQKLLLIVLFLSYCSELMSQDVNSIQLGKQASELQDIDWITKKPVEVSNKKNQVVVIDFFRTWYPPCRFTIIDEIKAQKALGNKVRFIGITDEPEWQIKLLKKSLPSDFEWYVGNSYNDKALADIFANEKLPRIPYTIIIDRDGTIVWADSPPQNIEEILGKILNKSWDLNRAIKLANDEVMFWQIRNQISSTDSSNHTKLIELGNKAISLELPKKMEVFRAYSLSGISEKLLANTTTSNKYLPSILKFSKFAVENGKSGYYKVYENYATALYMNDNIKEAAINQKKAVEVVRTKSTKDILQKKLSNYLNDYKGLTGELPPEFAESAVKTSKNENSKGLGNLTILTSKQALEDLNYIYKLIKTRYAGYDDFEWELLLKGSCWKDRYNNYSKILSKKWSWTREELFEQLSLFLEPVIDEHFSIKLPDLSGEKYIKRKGFSERHTPYFTDLRVINEAGKYFVSKSDNNHSGLIGAEVINVPVVTAINAELNKAFLFPTISSDKNNSEYLLGMFFNNTEVDKSRFSFRKKGNKECIEHLELHRGRVKNPNVSKEKPWELINNINRAIPILKVSTAVEDSISDNFYKSARLLRNSQVSLLDLRGNLGGSDIVARNWCKNFYNRDYHYAKGNAMFQGGEGNVASKWGPISISEHLNMDIKKDQMINKKLFVLIDENTASSGETFIAVTKQIPGVVLVGENSRGCITYGNAEIVKKLPNSGISCRFGWVKFNWAGHFPIREGVGFFPDFWIDDADPYELLKQ